MVPDIYSIRRFFTVYGCSLTNENYLKVANFSSKKPFVAKKLVNIGDILVALLKKKLDSRSSLKTTFI